MSWMTLEKVNSHTALVSKELHQASAEGGFWQPNEVVLGSVLHLHVRC